MKKTILVLGLFIISISLPAQVEECAYAKFYKDSTYFSLGENVNIRLNPDTAGKVISQVAIGEKIRIIEDTEISYTRNGYTANWYRIFYNNRGAKAEGYIWGGFLATQVIKTKGDDGIIFMYGITKVIKQEYFDEVYINVRVIKENKQLAKLDLRAVGGLRTYNFAETLGSKGVDGVKDILRINFSDGYCGGSFGDIYLFWDGKNLFHVKTLDEGFDAPYSATNKFIFPADEKGKKGLIINKSESGFYSDDSKYHIEDWERITYKWDGEKLVSVKAKKKK
jgi:hypothetical protein